MKDPIQKIKDELQYEGKLAKDDYTMWCKCNKIHQDGSEVGYAIEDWVRMVYQNFPNGTKRKAQYDNGKWEYTF